MPLDRPLLAFDTSAAHCAAALLWRGEIIAEAREPMAKGQAERLMPLIEEMLTSVGRNWRDLGALAVGVGPGNFTGIRISVAAARGLALGLGVPAVGVTSTEALANGQTTRIRVATPATRNALYVQDFDAGAPLGPIREAKPEDADFWPAPNVQPIGDWPETDRAIICPDPLARIRALAFVGAQKVAKGAPLPAPFYLRAADAAPPSDPPPVILDA
ncbi:tRNA (adenosine(37)-N6)-threonylcarbamoyltransferase complex dimerization subunit type 1 TsaB (plasmid) [Pseudorhodobacter turbinis]|uniref:tRNA (Adenosine(37)-N6)-threonylcarbamoyltransferase complex dimerization subunit type 1 TsaB n=1 Tax=Pseudorhodobacter turbinis TaxID=2500533 RepID=A0A4P8EJK8_9RHOB|nr:tRNA (adenosine(37)-N6)-threonylcarbamoyltransferase complex dimerization subunit type 1 TsaB [Pseudorhodobacter turbinis]QCO57159.1 tRNA (adenosine(37)-N6)-threonylcarbamoyltransferase complex dimerization subunit type 1 TsaB [Pseudorhodobacter turbinis]